MYQDLTKMINRVIEIVIQGSILNKVFWFKHPRFDIEKKTNHKKKKEFHLGFATDSILSDLKRQDVFDQRVINKFYANGLLRVEATFKKLSTRCPLRSVVVRNAIVLILQVWYQ